MHIIHCESQQVPLSQIVRVIKKADLMWLNDVREMQKFFLALYSYLDRTGTKDMCRTAWISMRFCKKRDTSSLSMPDNPYFRLVLIHLPTNLFQSRWRIKSLPP